MSAKKGLGRGFDSLIPAELLDESFDPTADQDEKVSDLRNIKLTEIEADPDQPRRIFDDAMLEELADSIKLHGVLQPIVVTPKGNSKYVIVAGERRYRAATIAGLDKIPALVRTLSNQHRLEVSLIENLQRTDLNVMEKATAYLKLRDQFNLTLDQIGQRLGGRSMSAVSNTLRLLRLPKFVQNLIVKGDLREGQARPLIGLEEDVLKAVVPKIIAEEWSARKIEQFVVELKKSGGKNVDAEKAKQVAPTPYKTEVEVLKKRLGSDIVVKSNARGAGQIVIKFRDDKDFHRISQLLG